MTAAPPLLEARDAAVGYRGVAIAAHVSLTVRVGELWVLLGSNGVGKSTFVQTALGLIPPVAGLVRLGVPCERVGFVPQRCEIPATVPTTVRELVSLGTVGTHADAATRRERLDWALEHVGLADLARHDFATLSGGQRQRALVARALVRRPSLLVLDEPTTHLDVAAGRRLLELLRHLHRLDDMAIVMVSHDVEAALAVSTHVALFQGGSVTTGSRDEVAGALGLGATS